MKKKHEEATIRLDKDSLQDQGGHEAAKASTAQSSTEEETYPYDLDPLNPLSTYDQFQEAGPDSKPSFKEFIQEKLSRQAKKKQAAASQDSAAHRQTAADPARSDSSQPASDPSGPAAAGPAASRSNSDQPATATPPPSTPASASSRSTSDQEPRRPEAGAQPADRGASKVPDQQVADPNTSLPDPIVADQALEEVLPSHDMVGGNIFEVEETADHEEQLEIAGLTAADDAASPAPPAASRRGSQRGPNSAATATHAADLSADDNIVAGAAWLSIGKIFSRILGAIYVIPWATWLGEGYQQANALFSIGYKPYSLFLAIATGGFPSAIAKQMAYFHGQKEYKAADTLFKYSLWVMGIAGVLSGGLLFILAPTLAKASPTTDIHAATWVIRSLSPALLILPVMSLLRGYFQGFKEMAPTAISEILEQIARVLYMLGATYLIMKVFFGGVTQAVIQSTFAAFIGAVASLVYLLLVYSKRYRRVQALIEASPGELDLDFMESFKIMLKDSIPFIILGSGIILAQNIDTYTFDQIISRTSTLTRKEISILYGAMSLDVDKLIMIVISIAVALSTAFVPTVTQSFSRLDFKATSKHIDQIIKVFCFVMFPAAAGMAVVAKDLYQLFYAQGSPAGPGLLRVACLMSVVLGLYTILSTLLQAMNFRRLAVIYLVIGLVVKLMLQFPLLASLQAQGAQLATTIAFAVSSVLMWRHIHQTVLIDYESLKFPLIGISISTLVMVIATSIWSYMLGLYGPFGRLMTFGKLMVVVLIGVLFYGVSMGMFGQLEIILGNRFKTLQDKLRYFK